jgi:DNA primase
MYPVQAILDRLHLDYIQKGSTFRIHCINPDHDDKRPSMQMNEEGVYHCYPCGEKGNLHTLIKKIAGVSFYEFLDIKDPMSYEFKAKLAADERKKRMANTKPAERKLEIRGGLYDPHKSKEVMKYLHSINMNDDFIKHFEVKYTNHAQLRFFKTFEFTHFYNRVVIPVYSENRVVNMIGRDFTGKNNEYKEIYPKGSTTDTFFNIDNIDFNKPVIIVEGMKGLIRVWQHFNKNVMSSFGSSLGPKQQMIISKIKDLLLFCDHDKAGWIMADHVYKLRSDDFWVTCMRTEGHDPADGALSDIRLALERPISSIEYNLRRHNRKIKKFVAW